MAHRPDCKRTPDTYDPDCDRCRELGRLDEPPRPKYLTPNRPANPNVHQTPSGDGVLWVFSLAFVLMVAGVALAGLYALVRFVKWSWQG